MNPLYLSVTFEANQYYTYHKKSINENVGILDVFVHNLLILAVLLVEITTRKSPF